ncbi:glycosyltransferase family 2 protein [Actinomyces haliotis]|uniref:glycosyltransferase family 2 protein n=1 Tax=Actinomyces haliotis TaxID=1280843 RepID=UPI00188DF55E|nr:glycosyltransferase family 2 protein [Actinomyces haliotis]
MISPVPAANARPSALVVIVNWRRPDLTRRAATSIEHQLGVHDRLVVVDNASEDGSVEELRKTGLDVIVNSSNAGFGSGVNLGAHGMREDTLVLLNNDAVADDGFIDALVMPLAASSRLGATTALILLSGRWKHCSRVDPAALSSTRGAAWRRVTHGDGAGQVLVNSTGNVVDRAGNGQDRDWLTPVEDLRAQPEVFGLCGGACAIRRTAWEEVGGFREDLFMYYEDTDLSYRLHEHGWQIRFVHDAVALHEHAASSGADSPMFIRVNARNRIIVAAEHSPWPVVLRSVVHSAARAAQAGLRGPVAAGVKQGLAGLPAALRRRHSRWRGTTGRACPPLG